MAAQDWQSSFAPTGDSYPPPAPPPLRYELRPLAVGEILDRIFSLYRTNFWLFVGLSAVSAGVSVAAGILRLVYMHFSHINAASPTFIAINGVLSFFEISIYLIAYSLTHAATTSAVHALYLGQPTSLTQSLTTARKLWLRCLGIALWQGWSAVWVFFCLLIPFLMLTVFRLSTWSWLAVPLGLGLFASVFYGAVAYLRNSLAIPSAVVESLGVRKSMARSKRLASGDTGRIFLLVLLFYALWIVAALIQTPLAIFLVRTHSGEHFILQAILLLTNFVSTSLVGPVGAIGLCLFYFDERVRKEGFDLDFMLLATQNYPPPPPISAFAADDLPAPENL